MAIAAFMVLGAFTAPKASAGEVLSICGPEVIHEGDTVIYVAQLDDTEGFGSTVGVDLDDITGDSDITSELLFDDTGSGNDEEWEYTEIEDTDRLDDAEVFGISSDFTQSQDVDDIVDLLEGIQDDFDVDFDLLLLAFLEDCGEDEKGFIADVEDAILECIIDEDCENDWVEKDNSSDLVWPFDVGLNPTEIAEFVAQEILDDPELLLNCDDLYEVVQEMLTDEGVSTEISEDIAGDVEDLCLEGAFLGDVEGFVLVDVTCQTAGEFELSFEPDQEESEPGQIEVQCVGDVDDAEIAAVPTTVEIVPARGSTFASLITLNLVDENGDPAGDGTTVVWTTDRCRLFSDWLRDPGKNDKFTNRVVDIFDLFGQYNKNDERTTANINMMFDPVTGLLRTTRTTVEVDAMVLDTKVGRGPTAFDSGDVISAVILDCSATTNTPGIAKVMACIDVEGADICKTVNVTVVGPPVAPVVLTTDQTNVRCGERVQITATIKDAAGQNVSDHTLVEVATNAGGVLGGTGAIAGEAGLVSPVSSTVAETNNGVATFWLITSELHQGVYTVLVTTGGGGSVAGQLLGGLFSTPPVSGSVTVTCGGPTTSAPSAPSPAATVRAPSTGQGITPPSTGDAGLADASGSSWALFVIAGLTVFALAGVASIKFARR